MNSKPLIDRLLDVIPDLNRVLDWADYLEKELRQHGLKEALTEAIIEVYYKGYEAGRNETVDFITKILLSGQNRGAEL